RKPCLPHSKLGFRVNSTFRLSTSIPVSNSHLPPRSCLCVLPACCPIQENKWHRTIEPRLLNTTRSPSTTTPRELSICLRAGPAKPGPSYRCLLIGGSSLSKRAGAQIRVPTGAREACLYRSGPLARSIWTYSRERLSSGCVFVIWENTMLLVASAFDRLISRNRGLNSCCARGSEGSRPRGHDSFRIVIGKNCRRVELAGLQIISAAPAVHHAGLHGLAALDVGIPRQSDQNIAVRRPNDAEPA